MVELATWAQELGIKLEPRAENTEEQNGLTERAGKSIMTTARALRIQGNLPKSLANELTITTVNLLNRTPTESNGWRTRYEMVTGNKPSLAHCAEIGSKAYVLDVHLKRGDKLQTRTMIGFLVGYDSTQIYRVWMPTKKQIIRSRDIVFMQGTYFEGLENLPTGLEAEELVEVLDIPEAEDLSDELVEHLLQPEDTVDDSINQQGTIRTSTNHNRTVDDSTDSPDQRLTPESSEDDI